MACGHGHAKQEACSHPDCTRECCAREEGRREGYAACQADVVAWLKVNDPNDMDYLASLVERGEHTGAAGWKPTIAGADTVTPEAPGTFTSQAFTLEHGTAPERTPEEEAVLRAAVELMRRRDETGISSARAMLRAAVDALLAAEPGKWGG